MSNIKIYEVGGCIRDRLLGVVSKDVDYAVEAPSWAEMKKYIASKGTIYLETPEYFTIRAKIPALGDADFVLCRKDGEYTDGRRPDTVDVGTIWDDLARRDFTMNAIARDVETGHFLDPFGGMADISLRRIKCVGSAKARITEDSLRMLRAIRFAITKGFEIDLEIQEILQTQFALLKNVSEDRVREEIRKAFKHDTLATLNLLSQYPEITRFIFTEFKIRLEPKSYV